VVPKADMEGQFLSISDPEGERILQSPLFSDFIQFKCIAALNFENFCQAPPLSGTPLPAPSVFFNF
jgi:hypothetical protein